MTLIPGKCSCGPNATTDLPVKTKEINFKVFLP